METIERSINDSVGRCSVQLRRDIHAHCIRSEKIRVLLVLKARPGN